jgi:antitoxin CptB
MNEDRIKKILYLSNHRGIKELDIILGNFTSALVSFNGVMVNNIKTLSQKELDDYEDLCTNNEWDIYSWLTEDSQPPEIYKNIVKKIIEFNALTLLKDI